MSFAAPTALLLAGLAIPIVILYILKVRLRREFVSTNLFWKQIYEEKPPRSIWQNLRHWLSLLAQLFLLLLLVLAVADPFLPWQEKQARRIAIIIDNSASMQADDIEPTRLDAAKNLALSTIDGLRELDQVAVIVADKNPRVVIGMSNHPPSLRRAIQEIQNSDNPTHVHEAVKLGQQLVGDHPHGQVLVLSDACTDNPIDSQEVSKNKSDSSTPVRWERFSEESNNVGITQFQTRRSLADSIGYEILTSVWNASSQPVQCQLEITLDEIPVDVIPLKLEPDQRWKRSFEKTSLEGGKLVAKLSQITGVSDSDFGPAASEDQDSTAKLNRLLLDDQAFAILPSRSIQKVLIVSPGNIFLQKAFEANPLVALEVRKDFPSQWPNDTIIVLHQNVPENLPEGNLFVIDPLNNCDLWQVGGVLEHPIVTEQAEDSPLMRHIRMDNVVVPEARKLTFPKPPLTLAGTVTNDVIYAQVQRPVGRCLVLGVNLEASDLAFRTAFPIMVTNALTAFANENGELQPSLATGSLFNLQLELQESSPTDTFQLESPSGKRSSVPIASAAGTDDISGTVGPLDEIGVWTVRKRSSTSQTASDSEEGEIVKQIAVNLAHERETDLRANAEIDATATSLSLAGGLFTRPLWFYLTLLAGLVCASEWFMYQRRIIT